MPAAIQTNNLLDAFRLHMLAAWPDLEGNVYLESPRTKQNKNYAFIEPGILNQGFEGPLSTLTDVTQENNFLATGFFRLPSDPSQLIVQLKVNRANALLAELQESEYFIYPAHGIVPAAAIGTFPLVTSISFEDDRTVAEGVYSLTISFMVYTSSPHH